MSSLTSKIAMKMAASRVLASNPQTFLYKIFYQFGFKDDAKMIIKVSVPYILTVLSAFMLPTISLLFCARIGIDEFVAVTLALAFINIFGFIHIHAFSCAYETVFQSAMEARSKGILAIELQIGLIVSLISSLPSMGLALNSKNIMVLLKQKNDITQMMDNYIVIFLPSIMLSGFSTVLSRFLQCQGYLYPVVAIYCLVNAISCGLHALLIFNFKIGVSGAAIASVISYALLPIMLTTYIYFSGICKGAWPGLTLKCLENWKVHLKLSIKNSFALFLEFMSFELAIILCTLLRPIDIAILSIAHQLLLVSYIVSFVIGAAACFHIDILLKTGKFKEANNAYKVSMTLTAISSIFIGLFLWLTLNYILPYAFTSNRLHSDIAGLTSQFYSLIIAIHIFNAFQGTLTGILKVISAQFLNSLITLIVFTLVILPTGLTLMLHTSFKVNGFFIGMLSGLCILTFVKFAYIMCVDWSEQAFQLTTKIEFTLKSPKSRYEELETLSDKIKIDKKRNYFILNRLFICLGISIASVCLIFTRNAFPLHIDTHLSVKSFNQTIST